STREPESICRWASSRIPISSAAAPCNPAALTPSLRICFCAVATALVKRACSSATWLSSMVYSGTLTDPDSTRWAVPTAMPEDTPTPSKTCSFADFRRRRSVFIELPSDKVEHGGKRLFRITPVDDHLDLVAEAGGKHHQSHDRTPVSGKLAAAHL